MAPAPLRAAPRPAARPSFLTALALAPVLAGSAVALADTGVVNATFNWTDRGGGVHPLRGTYTNGFYNTTLSSGNAANEVYTYTDLGGNSVFSGQSLFGSLDFYGNVSANIGDGNTSWFQIFNSAGVEYSQRWPVVPGTYVNASSGNNGAYSYTFDNTNQIGRAMGIGQAIRFMDRYVSDTLGASAPYVRVRFDGTTVGSFYDVNDPAGATLQIDQTDWANWDVIMHEFGHHVAQSNGMAGVGGPHSFGGDNIRGTGRPGGGGMPPNPAPGTGLGAASGTSLAWGEGLATYLGLSAIRSGNLQAAVPGLQADEYDDWYDKLNPTGDGAAFPNNSVFSVRAEAPRAYSPTDGFYDTVRRGEGDEYSVLLALWDAYDATNETFTGNTTYHAKTQAYARDRVNYGDRATWDRLLKPGGGAKNFKSYWAAVTADAGTADGRAKIDGLATNQKDEAVAAHGEILEAAGISGVPLSPDPTSGNILSFRPTFTFLEQNNSNSDYFRILVFSLDWSSIVFGSGVLADPDLGLSTLSYTPGVDIPMGQYWWVVLNSPAGIAQADVTGNANRYAMYWSGARRFTIIPTPGALALLSAAGVLGARRRRR